MQAVPVFKHFLQLSGSNSLSKISSSVLIELLSAYEMLSGAYIPELVLELALVKLVGEGEEGKGGERGEALSEPLAASSASRTL